MTVRMPADERYAMLADLDRDGRQDVVIQYPAGTPHRVVVLMARGGS